MRPQQPLWPQSEKPTRLPSSERTFIVHGDLLTVNTYDSSERTFIVLGDLLTVNARKLMLHACERSAGQKLARKIR